MWSCRIMTRKVFPFALIGLMAGIMSTGCEKTAELNLQFRWSRWPMLLVGGIGFVVERSREIRATALKQLAREKRRASRKRINPIFILLGDSRLHKSWVFFFRFKEKRENYFALEGGWNIRTHAWKLNQLEFKEDTSWTGIVWKVRWKQRRGKTVYH